MEPVVLHVRSGGSSNDLRKSIVERLQNEFGFVNLDVNALIRDENERKTSIGLEFLNMVAAGKIIPAEMIVRMLRKIIYSGDGRDKFILSSFPDIIEQAKEFEKSCATISAILYAANRDAVVEIKNNNLTLFNIDALFQKEFRLKTIKEFSGSQIEEILQSKPKCVLVYGRPLSGQSTISNLMATHLGYKVLNYKNYEEKVKKSKGTDEEPFEGEVPVDEVYEVMKNLMLSMHQTGTKDVFVIDGSYYKDIQQTIATISSSCDVDSIIQTFCEKQTIVARLKKKLEVEELSEEQ